VSAYSLLSAIFFFSVGLFAIKCLRNNTEFLVKSSIIVLLCLTTLSIIRILLPLDLSYAFVISSTTVLPIMQEVLNISIWNKITIGILVIAAWGTGAVVLAGRILYNFTMGIKSVKACHVVENEQVRRVLKKYFKNQMIRVFVSPDIDVPKVFGFRKAYIYIPELTISDDQLKLVIEHELQHIKGRDTAIKILYIFIRAIFWWNPIVCGFQEELNNVLELRCDRAITKDMNSEERVNYLSTILETMKQCKLELSNPLISIPALVSLEIPKFTKQRFQVVLNESSDTGKHVMRLSLILTAFIFIASYLVIVQPDYLPPVENIEGYVEVSEDNSYIVIGEDGIPELFVDNEYYRTLTREELGDSPYNKLKIIRREVK